MHVSRRAFRVTGTLLLALGLHPVPLLHAQAALWADVDAGVTDLPGEDVVGGSAALTGLIEKRALRLVGIGSWSQDTDGDWAAQGVGGAAWTLGRLGVVTPSLEVEGSVLALESSPNRADGLARGRLYGGGRRRGGWLGAGGGVADDGNSTRGVWLGELGGWMDAGPTTLTTVASFTGLPESPDFSDLELAAAAVVGRLSMRAAVGWRWWLDGTVDDEGWAEGSAAWQLDRRLALTLSGGRFPSDPLRGLGDGGWVQVGVRLGDLGPASPSTYTLRREARRRAPLVEPMVRRFEVESRGAHRRITIRARTAGPVELMGDFTDWQPVRMFRMADDRWVVELDVPAGSYRMNVRLAGDAWGVPPDLPLVRDDFDAVVALLVLN